MKKKEVVKSNILFNEIIHSGIKKSNNLLTLFYMEKKEEKNLFGIAAPKKLGNAVLRNKVKRQMRELLDDNKLLFPKYRNYIIIIKEPFIRSSFIEKQNSLRKIIGEINEEK